MSTVKKPRHSPDGGYARGEETRRRILEAAIELFGEHGFDGASTRDIAALAGVNAPALQYYFENKEGVYRACVEMLADDAWATFGPAVDFAREALAGNADTPVLIDALIDIQSVIADRTLEKVNKPGRRLFFAREQAGYEPESATQILECKIREPLNEVSTALVARITGLPADDPVTVIRTFSLHGQMIVFHIAHRSTLSALGWKTIDNAKAELLKSTIRDQTRTLLEHWGRERDEAIEAAKTAATADGPATATKTKSAKSRKRT